MRERVFPATPAREKKSVIDIDPGVRQHGLPLREGFWSGKRLLRLRNFARQAESNSTVPTFNNQRLGCERLALGDMRKLTISPR